MMKGLFQVGRRRAKSFIADDAIEAMKAEYIARGGTVTICKPDAADGSWEPRLLNYAVSFGKRHGAAA